MPRGLAFDSSSRTAIHLGPLGSKNIHCSCRSFLHLCSRHYWVARNPYDKVIVRMTCYCAAAQVLNELVMDRGMSPFLTSLDCYCDDNHITDVQAN